MKYMLFLYEDEASFHALPQREQEAIIAKHMDYSKTLADAGVMVAGNPLDHPGQGAIVRNRNGRAIVEDGPFSDAKEQLGGYYIIDVDSLEAALDWATRCPAAHGGGTVEVRPVWNPGG